MKVKYESTLLSPYLKYFSILKFEATDNQNWRIESILLLDLVVRGGQQMHVVHVVCYSGIALDYQFELGFNNEDFCLLRYSIQNLGGLHKGSK